MVVVTAASVAVALVVAAVAAVAFVDRNKYNREN